MPRFFLHLEGSAILIAVIALYSMQNFSWWTFALFLLAPDLAFLLYPVNRKAGSILYNLVHTLIFPLAIGLLSAGAGNPPGIQVALIWLAHIGMDRAFGYGFKYLGEARETHFSRI